MTAKRVLCIAGSTRRHGNSDDLLDVLSEGVSAGGGDPVRLVASQLDIASCTACHSCSKTGECVIPDEMDQVYDLLDAADAIAIATPVYFATVPGPLKTLYDRCQPYWARRYVLGEPAPEVKRPGALVVVGGGGDPFGVSCAVAPSKSVLAVLGVSLDDVFELVGPDERGDARRDEAAVARARAMGRALAERD